MPDILVIDDDNNTQELIKYALKEQGYSVKCAGNGIQGIEMYKAEKASLVITDIFMPEMDGMETILEFQRLFPGVKIIAMSGGGVVDSESYLATAADIGGVEALSKPFSLDELMLIVERCLGS